MNSIGNPSSARNTTARPGISTLAEVIVLIVTTELCALPLRLTVEGFNEHEAYVPGFTGAHVSTTGPVNPLIGVTASMYVAGDPLITLTEADEPPSTVGLTYRGFNAFGTWQDRMIDILLSSEAVLSTNLSCLATPVHHLTVVP